MEITLNMHNVEVGPNNVYLVTGERAAFIDSSHDDDGQVEALLDCWKNAGRPELAGIVVTHRHPDHAGGARKLAEATRGETISTPLEKGHIEEGVPGTLIDRTVTDGETLELGGTTLEFVHTPGHTLGNMSVYYRERKVLFAGDTIRNDGPFHLDSDPSAGDIGLHLKSLRKLLAYDIRLICPGHGPEIDHARAFIEKELATLQSEYAV